METARQGTKLTPKPVPQRKALSDWKKQKQDELGLHIQLHYRDLPRQGAAHTGHGKKVGEHNNTTWLELSKDEAGALVPDGTDLMKVPRSVRDKIFCKGLKDIVYGQSPDWKVSHIRSGELKVRRGKTMRSGMVIELIGTFDLKDHSHQYTGTMLGKMFWSPRNKRITRMEIVATGNRTGGTTFNFRNGDETTMPLGVSFFVE